MLEMMDWKEEMLLWPQYWLIRSDQATSLIGDLWCGKTAPQDCMQKPRGIRDTLERKRKQPQSHILFKGNLT